MKRYRAGDLDTDDEVIFAADVDARDARLRAEGRERVAMWLYGNIGSVQGMTSAGLVADRIMAAFFQEEGKV